jgi:hypothetical protein
MQDNTVARLQSARVQTPFSPPLLNVMYCVRVSVRTSVADPDPNPDPPDPHVLGLLDPDHQSEVWIRIRILLSLSKNNIKTIDFYCFVTFFLSLKIDVNVPLKSNMQKNFFLN